LRKVLRDTPRRFSTVEKSNAFSAICQSPGIKGRCRVQAFVDKIPIKPQFLCRYFFIFLKQMVIES
jgi:hypothetical protein